MIDCPECNGGMKLSGGVYKCMRCGLEISEDELIDISNGLYDDDDIPEGCVACGGDYPDCADSCPMYD